MNNELDMLYCPNDVALIINMVIGSHGCYLETPNVVGADVAFKIMFHVFGGEYCEALVHIKEVSDCDTKTAKDAVSAVRAYMGKTQ